MAAVIKKCTCEHKFQDQTYGKGNRLCNTLGNSATKARCTVCGKEIG